jgi:hypothetical protein
LKPLSKVHPFLKPLVSKILFLKPETKQSTLAFLCILDGVKIIYFGVRPLNHDRWQHLQFPYQLITGKFHFQFSDKCTVLRDV